MATSRKVPGRRIKIKDGTILYVEEFDHAFLIRGPGVLWGPTIAQAQEALFIHLGRKKWARIKRMPARPLNAKELTDDGSSYGCVALYFAIGAGAEQVYKP